MSNGSILPGGEDIRYTPEEILRYLNADGLRQLLRQNRLHLNLKPNKDMDYFSISTTYKYSSDLHNEGVYQRMEIRTFPDHGARPGYVGVHVTGGEFPLVHDGDKWDKALSPESLKEDEEGRPVARLQIGGNAMIPGLSGHGIDEHGEMSRDTIRREASIIFDTFDGRPYILSNDEAHYVNNEKREISTRLPFRTAARIGDIPTRLTDLRNDLDFVADPDYRHTDNNFTNSNRFIVDNIDDRTFVFPEVSKNISGNWIENYRVGLSGQPVYGESDGESRNNTQPDYHNDRRGAAINSMNVGRRFSGVKHLSNYFPGVFRSLEELNMVDLVGQRRTVRTHEKSPGGRRSHNYYIHDGEWASNWFDRYNYEDSYLSQSLHPSNMEIILPGRQPTPFNMVPQNAPRFHERFDTTHLYEWRYNRVNVNYHSRDISISIVYPGEFYNVGDLLRWTFSDDVIMYEVTQVGPQGQILAGQYLYHQPGRIHHQNPGTNGVGIPFSNFKSTGRGALLAVHCNAIITTHATQIKNNLYAYVDVVPTIRSDNDSIWSDVNSPTSQNGRINIRSTASHPAHSGVNSGRGGPAPHPDVSAPTVSDNGVIPGSRFHEHGGNATAGAQIHLFRYIIDTQTPTFIFDDNGTQVFMGRWVDQGPLSVERPCDIKALYLANFDTNNFNNFYKFSVDLFMDTMDRNPDSGQTNNANTFANLLIHKADRDPEVGQKFIDERFNPETSQLETIDITDKVLYVNIATGIMFIYNTRHANDPSFGYGHNPPGWVPFAGAVTR